MLLFCNAFLHISEPSIYCSNQTASRSKGTLAFYSSQNEIYIYIHILSICSICYLSLFSTIGQSVFIIIFLILYFLNNLLSKHSLKAKWNNFECCHSSNKGKLTTVVLWLCLICCLGLRPTFSNAWLQCRYFIIAHRQGCRLNGFIGSDRFNVIASILWRSSSTSSTEYNSSKGGTYHPLMCLKSLNRVKAIWVVNVYFPIAR